MSARMSRSPHPLYSLYLTTIIIVGFGTIAYAAYSLAVGDVGFQWAILASLTILTGSFTVKIPAVNSKISVADTFVFTNAILYGPAAGAITAALDGFMGSVRAQTISRRFQYILFNMAAMACSAFMAGNAFFYLLGRGPLHVGGPVTLRQILLPVGVFALLHYLANSGSVAVIVALEHR